VTRQAKQKQITQIVGKSLLYCCT